MGLCADPRGLGPVHAIFGGSSVLTHLMWLPPSGGRLWLSSEGARYSATPAFFRLKPEATRSHV
jgi:hypothetical protein